MKDTHDVAVKNDYIVAGFHKKCSRTTLTVH